MFLGGIQQDLRDLSDLRGFSSHVLAGFQVLAGLQRSQQDLVGLWRSQLAGFSRILEVLVGLYHILLKSCQDLLNPGRFWMAKGTQLCRLCVGLWICAVAVCCRFCRKRKWWKVVAQRWHRKSGPVLWDWKGKEPPGWRQLVARLVGCWQVGTGGSLVFSAYAYAEDI